MSTKSIEGTAFAGSIPASYDTYLGPFLFDYFAADLAARVELEPGGTLLETACGTGIATEALRTACGPEVEIVATDLSEAMVDCARERRGHLAGVRFRQADAQELAFDDDSFDLVVNQFGLMFMPDKLRALSEARRVLRPGGRLVFNVWDDFDSNPYVRIAQDTIGSFFDSDPPQFLELPWSFSDQGVIQSFLEAAGFADIDAQKVTHVSERPTAQEVARGLVCGNPTLMAVEQRATASCDEVVAAVARELSRVFGSAPFRAPTQAIVDSARR